MDTTLETLETWLRRSLGLWWDGAAVLVTALAHAGPFLLALAAFAPWLVVTGDEEAPLRGARVGEEGKGRERRGYEVR
jgi:hypothetical protein